MAVFKPVDSKLNFPETEEAILAFWQEKDIFARQTALHSAEACADDNRDHRPFVFYEGPPTANGIPHPGHVLGRVLKDIFLRHKSMQGHEVLRKAGWDTHGLPVEIEVEKKLGIEGKEGIEKYGIEPFVKQCKESVFTYADAWRKMTERIGFWVDLDNPYVTYHQEYIESIWWVLKTFWDADLLYHGHKIVPYCPRCGTPLSSHEVGLGYKEVADPSVFVAFKVKGEPGTSLLAWTTTPWTLISNVALAVGAEHDYEYVKIGEETLIMAAVLRASCMGKLEHEVIKTVKGKELAETEYERLFNWGEVDKPAFRVITADFIGLDAGSGIVHIAPAFGEDDYNAAQKENLPVLNLVQPNGTFNDVVADFKGMFVKDADKLIIKALRDRQQILKAEQYTHDYPFCWRCDSPLIYYARPSWYIRTTCVKDLMLENNNSIDWHPAHIQSGRFGNFLETNIDWALSRERFWGTPLPIWTCGICNHQVAIGSSRELQEMAKDWPGEVELHKPYVDDIRLKCPKCGGSMKRVPEVIDCWFDSGSMPFAQWGYPHTEGSMEKLAKYYPCDFITEAIDQTRGWFYSLLAIATLLKECARKQQAEADDPKHERQEMDPALAIFLHTPFPAPYKRCLVQGLVCDEAGYKMSKSKGNYLDPWEIMNTNGADAMRWYFYSNNQPWISVRFVKEAVRDAQKDFMVRLRNIWQFFVIYANIDGFDPRQGIAELDTITQTKLSAAQGYVPLAERSLLDRWINSKLETTTKLVTERIESLDAYGACQALYDFVDALSNWYVRRSRSRFWKSGRDADKLAAYWTLYECLNGTALLCAPIIPYMAEDMYQQLARHLFPTLPESVHLHPWPESDPAGIDDPVEEQMDLVREIASLGLSARASQKLKVRQPLGEAVVVLADANARASVEELGNVICEELNVKQLNFTDNAQQYVSYEIKLNFKLLGPKLGKDVNACAEAVSKMDAAQIQQAIDSGKTVKVAYNGKEVELTSGELEVRLNAREGYVAAQGAKCVVVIDTTVTEELKREGLARELINRIQTMRKELDLPYEARISVRVDCAGNLRVAAEENSEIIKAETLADDFSCDFKALDKTSEVTIEKEPVKVSLRKL
ncbi:MAG: isoleucine--tRNA ligase [Planctomycetes bacterium]|nr:isoleucine--tRNA ligase [Planctomycetota bacterium]